MLGMLAVHAHRTAAAWCTHSVTTPVWQYWCSGNHKARLSLVQPVGLCCSCLPPPFLCCPPPQTRHVYKTWIVPSLQYSGTVCHQAWLVQCSMSVSQHQIIICQEAGSCCQRHWKICQTCSTLALCAMRPGLWRVGCLLVSIKSPSLRWRNTTLPLPEGRALLDPPLPTGPPAPAPEAAARDINCFATLSLLCTTSINCRPPAPYVSDSWGAPSPNIHFPGFTTLLYCKGVGEKSKPPPLPPPAPGPPCQSPSRDGGKCIGHALLDYTLLLHLQYSTSSCVCCRYCRPCPNFFFSMHLQKPVPRPPRQLESGAAKLE